MSDIALINAMIEAAQRAATLSVGQCVFGITVESDGLHVRAKAKRPKPGSDESRVFQTEWVANWSNFHDNPRLLLHALDMVRDQLKSAAY